MESPIPLAFGITDLDIGGAERMLVELVTRLDRSAWRPSVVCLQPEGRLGDALRTHEIPVDSLGVTSPRQAARGLTRWIRILRRRQPAILHTYLHHANMLGRFAGRSAGVPLIVSGIRVADPRSRARHWADRLTQGRVDRYVCVSEGVAKFTKEHGIDERKIVVIPNGVDLEQARSAKPVDLSRFGVEPSHAALAYVGRLDREQKGLDHLMHALTIVRNQIPLAEKLRVIVIGDGPFRAELEHMIDGCSLESVVKLAGWQGNVFDWLAACDGLVLPSFWEGMPNVALEAMALGKPVVAQSVEGVEDLVTPGVTGWLAPRGDLEAFAAALRAFIESPETRRRFGDAARTKIETEYSLDRMVRRHDRLYRALVAAPSSRAAT